MGWIQFIKVQMTSLKRTLCSGKSKALTTNIHRVCSEGFLGLNSKNVCEGSNILGRSNVAASYVL